MQTKINENPINTNPIDPWLAAIRVARHKLENIVNSMKNDEGDPNYQKWYVEKLQKEVTNLREFEADPARAAEYFTGLWHRRIEMELERAWRRGERLVIRVFETITGREHEMFPEPRRPLSDCIHIIYASDIDPNRKLQ